MAGIDRISSDQTEAFGRERALTGCHCSCKNTSDVSVQARHKLRAVPTAGAGMLWHVDQGMLVARTTCCARTASEANALRRLRLRSKPRLPARASQSLMPIQTRSPVCGLNRAVRQGKQDLAGKHYRYRCLCSLRKALMHAWFPITLGSGLVALMLPLLTAPGNGPERPTSRRSAHLAACTACACWQSSDKSTQSPVRLRSSRTFLSQRGIGRLDRVHASQMAARERQIHPS